MSLSAFLPSDTVLPLIDTHTHFDVPEFHHDRQRQCTLAYQNGVRHLVLIGILANKFEQMVQCKKEMVDLRQTCPTPTAHLAFGLHPFYINEHADDDLARLEQAIQTHSPIALGEIGLDTFTDDMKVPSTFKRQQAFFVEQLELAKTYRLPALLHIRKSHGDALKLIKSQSFKNGGIAHSFSGGIQEAKAFVALGFKIGITGQITNPNAKKLRTTVSELVKERGLDCLVIETDCPDFTPHGCHASHGRRNTPATLGFVLDELAALLQVNKQTLADKLWANTCQAFGYDFALSA